LVANIYEATSLQDGLDRLKTGTVDACFLGATVSAQKAIDFVKTGSNMEEAKGCAFLAVVNRGNNYALQLSSGGVHGVIDQPYKANVLEKVLKSAVLKAREEHLSKLQAARANRTWTEAELIADRALYESAGPLYGALDAISQGLINIAKEIEKGSLMVKDDGTASLATNDAIRLVLEAPLGEESKAKEIGTFDNLLIGSLVAWFSDRVVSNQHEATSKLRRRLLSFHNPSQRHSN
jgi:hypothetical protein